MNDKHLSYENARAELVEVVQKLEAGAASLEESLTLWERGEELADMCQAHLEGARERLNERMGEPDDSENELVNVVELLLGPGLHIGTVEDALGQL